MSALAAILATGLLAIAIGLAAGAQGHHVIVN